MGMTINQKESLLEKHIRGGNSEVAVQLLFDLIVDSAKNKRFAQAEKYRDRLYDVDAMALNQIIKANEIIESEKSSGLDSDHFYLWEELYGALSKEEANALFYAMKEDVLEVDQAIIHQGKANNCLYFVNQGRLKVVHNSESKEVLINRMGSGTIFGDDTFFSINVCTSSVVTLSRSYLNYLDKPTLDDLSKKYPHLTGNLKAYCESQKGIESILKEKGLDRRSDHRYKLSTKLMAQVIKRDTHKPMSRPFIGELSDVSRGGLCFYIKTKNLNTMRMLTGRHLIASFDIKTHKFEKTLKVIGIVQGVQGHPFDEYSVHMKFLQALETPIVKYIQSASALI